MLLLWRGSNWLLHRRVDCGIRKPYRESGERGQWKRARRKLVMNAMGWFPYFDVAWSLLSGFMVTWSLPLKLSGGRGRTRFVFLFYLLWHTGFVVIYSRKLMARYCGLLAGEEKVDRRWIEVYDWGMKLHPWGIINWKGINIKLQLETTNFRFRISLVKNRPNDLQFCLPIQRKRMSFLKLSVNYQMNNFHSDWNRKRK